MSIEYNFESMFRDFMQDPVLFLSFGILGLTIGLMVFYTWYFISHIVNSQPEIEEQ